MEYDDAYFEMEDTLVLSLGADPKNCLLTTESSIGDFYYYHFMENTKENDDNFDLIIKHAEDTFHIKLDCNDKIVDVVKKLL